MILRQVALVSEVADVSASELSSVSAALQKQAARDFSPIWEVDATVDAFPTLEDVPIGYWPIIVQEDIREAGAAGVHLDKDGQPFALVQFEDGWSLTASHECLEMLADPFGNRLVAGKSPKKNQGRVEFLVEVCDPSEALQFAYTVNEVTVSDFYSPNFFDPVRAPGVRYSFTGAIDRPRDVLKGGYLSWHDPVSDHWFQLIFFGPKKQFRDLGVLGRLTESLRATIDRMTPQIRAGVGTGPKDKQLVAARSYFAAAAKATGNKAASWRKQIDALRKKGS